jgi:hypothetical protein
MINKGERNRHDDKRDIDSSDNDQNTTSKGEVFMLIVVKT